MKKLLAGCLIVVVIAIIGLGAAGYYAYRAVRPVIDNASNYMDKAREVTRLGEGITNKTPFEPPKNEELTQAQVERFIAVQTRVRSDMSDKWAHFPDIASVWVDARKSQVKALNIQKFSEAEYAWVRKRVYEAAGVQLAGSVDLSKFANVDLPKVPEKNIALIKPHIAKIKEGVPIAALGL